MAQQAPPHKIVRPLAKGQVTIPIAFRQALGIDVDTLLDISLVDDHLEIVPLQPDLAQVRRYADEEIDAFLEEDKLDAETVRRVRDLLRQ